MDMCDIEKEENLPKFDHSLRWKRKTERPPRRQVSPTKISATPPSLRTNHPMSDNESHSPANRKTNQGKNSEEVNPTQIMKLKAWK